MIIWPERPVDVCEPDLITAVDAFGVDAEEHFDAMSGPLRDLGSWHTSVEPQRSAAVPQVIRPSCQRRGGLGTSLEPSHAQQDSHLETLTLP